MLDTVQFTRIGQVLKSNGTDGQVIISLFGIGTEDISETEPVYIEFDGLPVPFFLSGVSQRGSSRILAHLTDVNSLDDAQELAGRAVYYPADWFEENDDFQDFTGWTLYDADGGAVGRICGLEPIPGNPCLEIETEKGTVLVPLHEDLVKDIDENGKALTMSIPDGLLS